jgi:hypothetical protein
MVDMAVESYASQLAACQVSTCLKVRQNENSSKVPTIFLTCKEPLSCTPQAAHRTRAP